jgi:hypothetical protein
LAEGDIEPERLYPIGECCRFFPSSHPGRRHPVPHTLHSWRRRGLLRGERVGGCWFIRGRELLRLLREGEAAWGPGG